MYLILDAVQLEPVNNFLASELFVAAGITSDAGVMLGGTDSII
jgi:hypothetical protein